MTQSIYKTNYSVLTLSYSAVLTLINHETNIANATTLRLFENCYLATLYQNADAEWRKPKIDQRRLYSGHCLVFPNEQIVVVTLMQRG